MRCGSRRLLHQKLQGGKRMAEVCEIHNLVNDFSTTDELMLGLPRTSERVRETV